MFNRRPPSFKIRLKKTELRAYALIVILVSLLFISCQSNDSGTEETPIDTSITVNPNFINIDWESNSVLKCDTANNLFTITETSQTKNIKPGNIVVLETPPLAGYILIVNSVSNENGNIVLKGNRGALCDIFANTSFTLSTEVPSTKTRSASSTNIYYPTEIIYADENGKRVTVPFTRASNALHLTGKLWKWASPDLSEKERTIYKDKNSSVSFSDSKTTIDVDLNLVLDFGNFEKVSSSSIKQYRSVPRSIKAYLSGSLENLYGIKSTIAGKSVFKEKEDELVKHNLLKPIDIKFIGPGGIPIYITLSANLLRGASLETEGSLSTYAGFNSSINLNAGFDWNRENGMSPIADFSSSAELVPPTVEGRGKITAKAWMYPRIFVMLYNTVGPSFDLIPFIGSELSGGFRKDLTGSSDKDYCAYTLKNFYGADFNAGLSLKFMNYEVERKDLGRKTIFQKNIYESPSKIELQSSSMKEPQVNKPLELVFEVYDKDILGNDVPTPLPQIVKFEAKGHLSSDYAITSQGLAKVTWTPASQSDALNAVLYNADGKVISNYQVTNPKFIPEPTTGDAVDLGLSVLWASCNLGTNNPDGIGNFYAWGETTTKKTFTNNNYVYYHPKDPNDGVIYPNEYTNLGYNISGTKYDAAHVNKGGKWRIPTAEEVSELISNCDIMPTTYKGRNGFMFISTINGKCIFVPRTGYYSSTWSDGPKGDECHYNEGDFAYWTGTLDTSGWPSARIWGNLRIVGSSDDEPKYVDSANRTEGLTIRPVKDK